jgi:hypothetical protein
MEAFSRQRSTHLRLRQWAAPTLPAGVARSLAPAHAIALSLGVVHACSPCVCDAPYSPLRNGSSPGVSSVRPARPHSDRVRGAAGRDHRL